MVVISYRETRCFSISVLVAIPGIVVTTHEAVIICRESMLLVVAITGRKAKLWSHNGYY